MLKEGEAGGTMGTGCPSLSNFSAFQARQSLLAAPISRRLCGLQFCANFQLKDARLDDSTHLEIEFTKPKPLASLGYVTQLSEDQPANAVDPAIG